MKILFFSDIHGIDENLNFIKELDDKEKFDKIVVLGDLYYPGPNYNNAAFNSNVVKNFLTNYSERLICIKGNCDSEVDIKASDFPICNNLSLICIDGLDIYCTHGNEYNIENNKKFKRKGVLVYGHEHYPYIDEKDGMTFINVGSISLPRNNSNPSYGVYADKIFTLYDISNNVIAQKYL